LASRLRSLAIVGKPTTRRPVNREFNNVAVAIVPIITDVCHREIPGIALTLALRGKMKIGSSKALLLFRFETVGDGHDGIGMSSIFETEISGYCISSMDVVCDMIHLNIA
jgi:hypothetical protein